MWKTSNSESRKQARDCASIPKMLLFLPRSRDGQRVPANTHPTPISSEQPIVIKSTGIELSRSGVQQVRYLVEQARPCDGEITSQRILCKKRIL